MNKFTVGPRVGIAIVFCIVILTVVRCSSTWGLRTEVAVLKQDSKVGKRIFDFEVASEREVAKYAEQIKHHSKSECNKFSIKQLIRMCTSKKSEQGSGNTSTLQIRDTGQRSTSD